MRADLWPWFRANLTPDERAEILTAEPRTASMVGGYDTRRGYDVRIAGAVPGKVLTGTDPASPIAAFRRAYAQLAEPVEIVSVLRGR